MLLKLSKLTLQLPKPTPNFTGTGSVQQAVLFTPSNQRTIYNTLRYSNSNQAYTTTVPKFQKYKFHKKRTHLKQKYFIQLENILLLINKYGLVKFAESKLRQVEVNKVIRRIKALLMICKKSIFKYIIYQKVYIYIKF